MSKRQVLMLLGALVAIFLFLGFPQTFDKVIAVFLGLLIIVVAYRLPVVTIDRKSGIPYAEHKKETLTTPNDQLQG